MKRIAVALVGGTLVLLGIVLLPLPGPGTVVIAAGVAFLATEFLWARRAMSNAKGIGARWRHRFWSSSRRPARPPDPAPATKTPQGD